MSKKKNKGGLGRGLGALIPTAPADADHGEPDAMSADDPGSVAAGVAAAEAPKSLARRGSEPSGPDDEVPVTGLRAVAGVHLAEIPISAIKPNARQPRQVFDEEALTELAHSIKEFGVLQPVVVRPLGDAVDGGDGYELVMGERRLRAGIAAGLTSVPAIVRSTADEAMLRDALLENIHRAQLNPLEEAAAYQQLLEEFDVTHEELARRLGRSRPQVSNTIRLLNLSIPVQRRVAAGVLSAGHARALLALEDSQAQDEIAARIVAEGLSVRATEELVALHGSGHADKKAQRRAAAPRFAAPAATELADKLSDLFDTRVRVDIGRRKGKVSIEFASIDDLERIVAVMAPDLVRHRADARAGGQNEP